MFLLFFLTVLTNVLAGVVMAGPFLIRRYDDLSIYIEPMRNGLFRIILGISSIAVALINIFPTYPNDVLIIGDLFPVLAGMVSGIMIIAGCIREKDSGESGRTQNIAETVEKIAGPYETTVGIVVIIVGLAHLIFAKNIFF